MDKLEYEVKRICRRNRDGSYGTQRDRRKMLVQIARLLLKLGFRGLRACNLKPKHVNALVDQWMFEGLDAGTIKNRMACLRWLAEKIGRPWIVAEGNDSYGISRREASARESKALRPENEVLDQIQDIRVQVSVILQKEFGLRREEAMKVRPEWADRGDRLVLRRSWAKGGRPREIPIETAAQREALDMAKRIAGKGSLIPPESSYKEQMGRFQRETAKVGLGNSHGLRHAYAQDRYEEVADMKPPVAGGKTTRNMSQDEKERDTKARLQVSKELGHNRKDVASAYLGGLFSTKADSDDDE